MSVAFVNRGAPNAPTSLSAIAASTTTFAVTAGNLLLTRITYQNPGTISLVFDTAGNTWNVLGTTLSYSNNRVAIYYAWNCLGNAGNQVTVAMGTASTYLSMSCSQFSGYSSADPFNGLDAQTGNSTSPATNSLTLVGTEAVIFAAGVANAAGWSAGSGFTLFDNNVTGDSTKYFMDEYKIVSASQVADATCGSGQWGIIGAIFGAPSSGSFLPRLTLLGAG